MDLMRLLARGRAALEAQNIVARYLLLKRSACIASAEHEHGKREHSMALKSWDERYLAIAMHVSQWSKDPSSKMGAVIADVKGRIVASGYNGFPAHVHDCPEILNQKEKKYQMVVHAEANAALIAGAAAADGTVYLYGRRPICGPCAGILIQAGIKRAVAIPPPCEGAEAKPMSNHPSQTDWAKSGRLAIQMFKEAKVQFEPVTKQAAVEETFDGLIKWIDHEIKISLEDSGEIHPALLQLSSKLQDVHTFVAAAPLF
jgi:dCMP deaminase